jgi:hypothetical protein
MNEHKFLKTSYLHIKLSKKVSTSLASVLLSFETTKKNLDDVLNLRRLLRNSKNTTNNTKCFEKIKSKTQNF